ncbi:hypothetical protein X474_11745 [Dethiosulfatarculus sandiegensis]|uniref:Uncharacterized protein n=1 Tax=Dethiosulfatarculus sandiegensis TaxID=1429043 RepID=A0A0D2GG35_9BACT|nr:hypothetical protein X474_11745 [Dethiosulfatarculus sandiegensis]
MFSILQPEKAKSGIKGQKQRPIQNRSGTIRRRQINYDRKLTTGALFFRGVKLTAFLIKRFQNMKSRRPFPERRL